MKSRLNRLLLAAGIAMAALPPALAQQAPASAEFAEGQVRKVDKPARKITVKHGEIKSLDMPPMTMVFGVSDPALLERVKAGDKVRFLAIDQGGQMTITEIQAVK